MSILENRILLNNSKDITDNLLLECDKNKHLILLLEDVSDKLAVNNNDDLFGELLVLIEILKKNNACNTKTLHKLFDNLLKLG